MHLYLMRHAEAVEPGTGGSTRDADRPLTEKGRRQARRMGRLLQRLEVEFDAVLASPLVRARETAEAVLAAMKSDGNVACDPAFAPNAAGDAMWRAIQRSAGRSVLVVGHLPSIARLAATLLGSNAEAPLHFHKSSLAVFVCETQAHPPRAELDGLFAPSAIRRLIGRAERPTEADW